MVNKELIDLCRTLVAAVQESHRFDASYLRRILLHVVPQLLVEIDILGGMIDALRTAPPEGSVEPAVEEKLEKAAAVAVASRTPKKRPAPKKKKGRRR